MTGPRPDSRAAPADFIVVGASHRTSSLALRDRLFVDEGDVPAFLSGLRAAGIDEGLVMSTCDRVEVQAAAADGAAAQAAALAALRARCAGMDAPADAFYALSGASAVRHVFAVASSLDSTVVGEPQVLGQVKDAHRMAQACAMNGPALEALLQRAYAAAKAVRSDTAIADGPVSLATAAVHAARSLFGDLSRVSAILIGGGDMGALILEQFRHAGLSRVTVAAATAERAEAAARRIGGHGVPYDGLQAALTGADLLICAAGTGRHLVDAAMVEGALVARRRRPVLIVDAAVPGDVDPAAGQIEDAFLFDLDDLESAVVRNRDARADAAAAAWRLVDAHVDAFLADRATREAVPALDRLRRHFEAVRAEVLSAARGADAEEATRRLVNRLLHDPTVAIRDAARDGAGENEFTKAADRLFGLESGAGDGPRSDEE